MKTDIIRAENIKAEQCPVFVFSDDPIGFVSWAIKWVTKGLRNHTMVMIRPGYFASQGARYKEMPVNLYDGCTLKFWTVPNITLEQMLVIKDMVRTRLRQPWWKKGYDWLGIVGQLTRIKWIHFPFRNFCSEGDAKLLRVIFSDTPVRPDPDQLDKFLGTKEKKGLAKVIGYSLPRGGFYE